MVNNLQNEKCCLLKDDGKSVDKSNVTLATQKSPPSCEEQFTRRVYWSWNLLYRWIKRGRPVHIGENCTMAVRSRTMLERVFPIYSGILNTSKPFKFICQRNLSQAQATEAKKLRAMVNVFVLLCRCFSWSSSYFSSIITLLVSKTDEYYRWEFFKKKWFIIKNNYLKMR